MLATGRSDLCDPPDELAQAAVSPVDRYWPAIVYWHRGELSADLESRIARSVRSRDRAHMALRCDAHTVVLLLAGDASHAGARLDAQLLVEQVVGLVRVHRPGSSPHAIVAEASVPVARVTTETRQLLRLRRYVERHPPMHDRQVLSDRSLALVRLLDGVDRRRALDFIARHIGALLAYDRGHGTNLAGVLEISLDTSNRDDAARAASMHRNTFRRHLKHARELVDIDLDDGDQCLAVHVALKLARVIEADPWRAPPRTARHGGRPLVGA